MENRGRPILGVSLKMYFTAARTREFVAALADRLAAEPAILDRIDAFVAPDQLMVASVVDILSKDQNGSHDGHAASSTSVTHSSAISGLGGGGRRLLPAAQDVVADDFGAFTGCVSPAVLAELGVRIVLVGHAERRRLFGETDAQVAAKAAAVVRHGLVPLVCVGETESAATALPAVSAIVAQVTPVLAAVPAEAEVLLAYEPVWAIGGSHPASADYVRAVVAGVRASPAVQSRPPGRTRILYGGSAGPGLFSQLDGVVDGILLGRFGHDLDRFMQTAREVAGLSV